MSGECENLIKSNFKASKPNEKFFIDNMQINCKDGSLQFIGILDAYARDMRYTITPNVKQEHVIPFMKTFIKDTKFAKGAIMHQDNGKEYKNFLYQELLKRAGVLLSYLKPGKSTDNSIIENCFKYIRRECEFKCSNLTKSEAIKLLENYMYCWNTKRTQKHNNYVSPREKKLKYYLNNHIKNTNVSLEIR